MLHLNLARFPPRDNSIVKYLGLKDQLKSESRTKGSIVEYLDRPEGLAGLPAAPHLLLVGLGALAVAHALSLWHQDARQPDDGDDHDDHDDQGDDDQDAWQPSAIFLLFLLCSSVPTP